MTALSSAPMANLAITHYVEVKCGRQVIRTGVPMFAFESYHPLVKLEFFAILQHRAKRLGPVSKLVWTAGPDPTYRPPDPAKPEQLGLFSGTS